jgi:peptidyl-prolyl cis-trans isomerase B (cyclophilin B)
MDHLDWPPPAPAGSIKEVNRVSPTSRKRQYAKRRYEKWQAKQVVRNQRRRRQRRIALAAATGVAAVVAVGVGVTMTVGGGGDDAQTTAAASASSTGSPASASANPAQATSTPGSSTASSPCPPALKAPGTAKSWPRPPAANTALGKKWSWTIETTCGPILIELDGAAAPQAVASTIFLVQQGFYSSTPCHRLTTKGIYVLQCGDPSGKGTGGPGYTYGPVENAPKNNVYPAGTIAMARQPGKGDSIGSQFFVVYQDSTIPSDTAGGYTVIGKITGGLGTVSKIAAGGAEGGDDGAPVRAVSIASSAVKPQ